MLLKKKQLQLVEQDAFLALAFPQGEFFHGHTRYKKSSTNSKCGALIMKKFFKVQSIYRASYSNNKPEREDIKKYDIPFKDIENILHEITVCLQNSDSSSLKKLLYSEYIHKGVLSTKQVVVYDTFKPDELFVEINDCHTIYLPNNNSGAGKKLVDLYEEHRVEQVHNILLKNHSQFYQQCLEQSSNSQECNQILLDCFRVISSSPDLSFFRNRQTKDTSVGENKCCLQ